MPRRSGVSEKVLAFFREYPDNEISLDDVSGMIDLDRFQVMHSISSLRRKGEPIVTVRKGVYRYDGAAPDGSTFTPVSGRAAPKAEVLGALDDGRMVVTIAGRLYVAQALEVEP